MMEDMMEANTMILFLSFLRFCIKRNICFIIQKKKKKEEKNK